MLVIRKEQIKILRGDILRRFEDEMVQHLATFSPPLFRVIKEDQMREAARVGIRHARSYGFELRGPIRLYLELMLLFGSHFDTDPQYPWAAAILSDERSVSEMQRAEWLFEQTIEYQERVSGEGGANTTRALRKLLDIGRTLPTFAAAEFEPVMHRELRNAFPEKVDFIGQNALATLLRTSMADARQYDLPSTRGEMLLLILTFAFGHRCADDPLYPWIGRTLTDERIVNGGARAERLEKKAMTWLEHVVRGAQGDLSL